MKATSRLTLLAVALAALGTFASHGATRVSTAAGGNWSDTLTWSGGVVPTSTDNAIILAGSSVTVTAVATVNSITFSNNSASTATLTVNSGIILTVTAGVTHQNAGSANTSVLIQGGGTMNCASLAVGGTTTPAVTSSAFTATLTSTISNLSVSGTLSVKALYNSTISAANQGVFALGSGNVTASGGVVFVTVPLFGPTLTLAAGNQNGTLTLPSATPFTITGGGSSTFTANGTNATVIYSGPAQTVKVATYNNLTLAGSGSKTTTGVSVNGTLTRQGTATVSAAPAYGTNATLQYAGSAAQTQGLELPPTIPNLTINNASGVTLTNNTTVSNTLALVSGDVATAAKQITIAANGGISGGSEGSYVNGNLEKKFNPGTQTFTWPIGNSSGYAPLSVASLSVSTAGGLKASTTAGTHPELASSGIDPNRSVNRYWTLTQSGGSFGAYNATFNYPATDVDPGATASQFLIKNWSGGWLTATRDGTPTPTSASLSGQNGFGDFAIGNPSPWYDTAWSYRIPIIISHTNVGGALTNFPVLINLTSPLLQQYARANGNDLLFTSIDGTNKLAHEIEGYDSSSGALWAWVKVPTLSATADTLLYLHFGNPSAANQQNATGVWDSSFKAVWHLGGVFTDSTSNSFNGANTGTTTAGGKISSGQLFVQTNGTQYITVTGLAGSPSNVTLSAWVNLTGGGSSGAHFLSLGDCVAIVNPTVVGFFYTGYTWRNTTSSTNITGTGWHYVAYSFATGSQNLYVDGVLKASSSYYDSISYSGLGQNTLMGIHGNGSANHNFSGTLDEVRISSTPRSAAWISTEYNNQSSPAAFCSAGSFESEPPTQLGFGAINNGLAPGINEPFSLVVQSTDPNGIPQNVSADTSVTLSLNTGSGTLSGNLSGTIPAGTSSVAISNVVYSKAETGIRLTATRASGDNLSAGVSSAFRVDAWFSNSWSYRIPITISHTQVTATLTNFPVLINLTNSLLQEYAQANGNDLFFTTANAPTAVNNTNVFHFDSSAAGWMTTWNASQGEDTAWDGAQDHTGNGGGSFHLVDDWAEGDQLVNLGWFSGTLWPEGGAGTIDLSTFTNCHFYLKLDTGNMTTSLSTFQSTGEPLRLWAVPADNNSMIDLGPITIPNSASNGWVRIDVPIDPTIPGLATAHGLGFKKWTGAGNTGKVAFWVDDMTLDARVVSKLPHEIETYSSANGALWAWVNVPTLSATADTLLYLYFGNPSAANQQNVAGVWDSNYKSVWHLPQSPTGSSGDMADSTSNANNGTSQTIPSSAQLPGRIGGSLTLDGGSDYISTANSFGNPTTLTMEAWIKTTSTAGHKVVGQESTQTETNSGGYDRQIYIGTDGLARFGTWDAAKIAADIVASTNAVNDGQWHHLLGYRDNNASVIGLYVDGVLQATAASTNIQSVDGWYRIGGYKAASPYWPGGNDGYFAGSVDEVRVSHAIRSASWISAEYKNQSSPATFGVAGSSTSVPGGGSSRVWNGLGSNANWSNASNWVAALAPTYIGDSLIFSNNVNTAPNMDNAYTVNGITFASSAASFTIGSANTLTLGGGITNNSSNPQTINAPIAITATQTVNAANGRVTLGGTVSGGGLIKSGGAELVLFGANTYTGPTVVNSGALTISGSGSLGGGSYSGAISDGGTMTFSSSVAQTLAGPISGGGSLTVSGGTVTLSGTNTFSGQARVIGGGLLSVSSVSKALGNVSDINLGGSAANGTLLYTGTGETSDRVISYTAYSGSDFQPNQIIDQSGSGLLKFTSSLSQGGGRAHYLTLQGSTGGAGEIAGNISGSGGTTTVVKNGTGIWTLSGNNSYTGGTLVNAGTLVVANATALGAGANPLTLASNVTLQVAANLASPQATTLSGPADGASGTGSVIVDTLTNATARLQMNPSSGAGLIVKDQGLLALSGTNTFNYFFAGDSSLGGNLLITNGSFVVLQNNGNSKFDQGANVTIGSNAVFGVGSGNGGAWFPLGDTAATTNNLTLAGGSFIVTNVNGFQIARSGNAALTINSGSVLVNDANAQGISMSEGGGYSTVNLNGGRLTPLRFRPSGGVETINFNGGTLAASASRTNFLPGSTYLTANVRNGGAVVDSAGFNITISHPLVHSGIAGDNAIDGGLTKIGTGTLTLSGTNTYTGGTVIGNGTLALGGTGTISNSASLSLAAGATFDAAAQSTFNLGSAAMKASGTGTAPGSTAATLNGGGMVDFSTNAIILNVTPSSFSGDTTHPALLVTNAALTLNNNAITITNAAATPLGAGVYRLVQVGNGSSGSISGTPNATPVAVSGSGIAAGTTASSISVSSGNINLTVQNITTNTLALSAGSNPSTYGSSVTFSATISPAPPNGETVTFKDGATTLGTGIISAGVANFSIATLARGSHSLTAEYSGDTTNTASTAVALGFNINPAVITVASGLTANNKTYNGTTAATISSNNVSLSGVVAGDAGNVRLSTNGYTASFATASVGAGKTVTVSGLTLTGSAAGNYTLPQPTLSANITTATVTVASGLTANSKTYDGTTAATIRSNSVSLSGIVSNDVVSLSTNGYTATFSSSLVGNGKVVTVSGLTLTGAGASNYTLTQPSLSANITAVMLTVTANNTNRIYGAVNPTFTASYSGFVNGQNSSVLSGSPALSTSATTNSPAGSYAITASQGSLSATNYSFAFTNGTLTVTVAALTVTANNTNRVYGAANPTFTGSVTGQKNGDNITATFATTASTNSPAGSYTITPVWSDPGNKLGNYTVTTNTGTLTVSQALLIVAANNTNRIYGTANPTFTASYSGFVNGQNSSVLSGSPALSASATTNSPAGNYTITASQGSLGATNYTLAFTNGTLTVTTAALTVTANNSNRIYGAANPAFTARYSGFVNGDTASVLSGTPSLTTAAISNSPVLNSPYPITVSQGTLSASNYSFNFVNGNLSVTPAPLTVSADHQSRDYGTANPVLTASYNGFVNREGISQLTGSPAISTVASNLSPVGVYPITITLGTLDNSNYTFGFTNGTLTILEVPPALTMGFVPGPGGQPAQFTLHCVGLTPGGTYHIEASPNLTQWPQIATLQADSTGAITFTDTNTLQYPTRFYRLAY